MELELGKAVGRVKWCPNCRVRYINAGPADPCLTCDGALFDQPKQIAPPVRRMAELDVDAYWAMVWGEHD